MPNKDLTASTKVMLGEKEVEIRPLTIRQLRKFVKVIKNLNTESNDLSDKDIDKMVEAASIALEKADPELAANSDGIEDVLDIKTFNVILTAAMGANPEA